MKPQLFRVTKSNGATFAILFDGDKVFTNPDDKGTTRSHYSRAVLMGPFKVGEILLDEKKAVILPRPAVIQMRKSMTPIDLEDSGLTKRTAAVLLNLAASANNVTIDDTKETFSLNSPAKNNTANGWCPWKFIAAWCWEKWLADGDKPAAMHKDLVRMGYKGNYTAFRKMMGRMGFVTHTKSAQSQQAENE